MNTGFTTGLVEGSYEDSDSDVEGGSLEESEDAVTDSEGEDTFLEDFDSDSEGEDSFLEDLNRFDGLSCGRNNVKYNGQSHYTTVRRPRTTSARLPFQLLSG